MNIYVLRLIGSAVFLILLVTAFTLSTHERRVPEGASGSYLGRAVADARLSADRERELSARVDRQRY